MLFLSVIKDIFFIFLLGWTVYTYKAGIYISLRHIYIRRLLVLFAVWSMVSIVYSLMIGTGLSTLIVGIKYTIRPVFLVISGIVLGYGVWHHIQLFPEQNIDFGITESKSRNKILNYIGIFLLIGLVLQVAKLLIPDALSLFGYGSVGDYVMGSAPPLYYRTGPGGMMRLQGLFSGPNNYAYFLVGLFPLLALTSFLEWKYHIRQKYLSTRLICIWLFFLISSVWTLSRSLIVGCAMQFVFLIFLYMPVYKKRLIQLGVCAGILFVMLSIYKRGSTVEHIYAWGDGFQAVIDNIWGYGLGSSGPSIHREGIYLPENTYLQYMLDTGVRGFLLVCGLVGYICKKCRYIYLGREQSGEKYAYIYDIAALGIVGLGVIGLFLHVFEDSMVNYLILFPYSTVIGLVIASKSVKN